MTKKHYIHIAAIIKRLYDDHRISDSTQYLLVSDLAGYFMQDNQRFNKDMFYRACGLDEQGHRITS